MEPIPSVYAIGDSWLHPTRVITPRLVREYGKQYLILDPHEKILNNYGDSTDRAFFKNFSRASLTFDRALNVVPTLQEWSKAPPNVTLLQIGSCDLANTPLGQEDVASKYKNKLIEFVTSWIEKTRQMSNNVVDFNDAVKKHKWLVVCPSDWGSFGEGTGLQDSDKYRQARRKASIGLNRKQKKLYGEYNIVLLKPRIEHADRVGIHIRNHSLEEYNYLVWGAVCKLLCTSCKFTEDFIKEEHDNIMDGLCKRTSADGAPPAGAAAY